MFQIYGIVVNFCLLLKKSSEIAKKIRQHSKEEIKQQMIDSIRNGNKIETEELNETADKIEKSEDAATITYKKEKHCMQRGS